MPRACSICKHPRVLEIDGALLESVAYRSVAKQFEASESAMYRHSKQHLPMVAAAATRAPAGDGAGVSALSTTTHLDESGASTRNAKGGVNLLAYMVRIQQGTGAILEHASAEGRHETALKAIRETRGNVELIAKLQAQLEGRNSLDLRGLTAEDLRFIMRQSMGELSARDRAELLLEAPELADLGAEFSLNQGSSG